MRVFKGLTNLPKFKNAVMTIGTYDGVHVGHQVIIQRINELANEVNGESVLLTFDPHPKLVLHPNIDLKLISSIEEKISLFETFGLDNLVITPFSKDFASTEAEDYVRDILVKYFSPAVIVIGYDHKFGKGRKGDIHLLRELGPKYHFRVEEIPAQTIDEISVSSTKVRKALLDGDIQTANTMLAHPFSMTGIVIDGNKLGRTLGFPTANMRIDETHKLIPPDGVYAVWVELDGKRYKGALSIGRRPTILKHGELRVEVYILHFNREIYGEEIKVIFQDFIRKDMKFNSTDELIEQMEMDVEQIDELLDNP